MNLLRRIAVAAAVVMAMPVGIALFAPMPSAPPQNTVEPMPSSHVRVIAAGAMIKRAMRNPPSLVWEGIHANTDGSVICFQYRAQNGFGGMSREYVVVEGQKATQSAATWNARCTKRMTSLIHLSQDIDSAAR